MKPGSEREREEMQVQARGERYAHARRAMYARRARSGVGPVEDRLLRRWLLWRDAEDREQLVRRLLPIARRLARRYAHFEPVDDLQQVACLGLMKAIDRFEPRRGIDLLAYAVPTMLGEIRHWLRDHSWAVRPPREVAETSLRLLATTAELTGCLGRRPTRSELAEHLGTTVQVIAAAEAVSHARVAESLDMSGTGADETLGGRVGREDGELEHALDRAWLSGLISPLPTREQDVVTLTFGDDLSQRQVAKRLGISQAEACRALQRALEKLRRAQLAEATGC